MLTSYELSQHNNIYRYWTKDISPIPTIVYNKFKKEYQEPSADETYTEIINISYNIDAPDYNLYFI